MQFNTFFIGGNRERGGEVVRVRVCMRERELVATIFHEKFEITRIGDLIWNINIQFLLFYIRLTHKRILMKSIYFDKKGKKASE